MAMLIHFLAYLTEAKLTLIVLCLSFDMWNVVESSELN